MPGQICVDFRESRSGIISALKAKGAESVVVNDQITDYIIGSDYGIERKTVADLVASIIDQRIFRQAGELKKNFRNPLILLEGGGLYTHNPNVRPNVIRGALLWLSTVVQVPVMRTYAVGDSAECLCLLATKGQKKELRLRPTLRPGRKPQNAVVQQAAMLAAIPGVGRCLAERLAGEFSSIKDILEGGADKLTEVPGVGKRKAESIISILSSGSYNRYV